MPFFYQVLPVICFQLTVASFNTNWFQTYRSTTSKHFAIFSFNAKSFKKCACVKHVNETVSVRLQNNRRFKCAVVQKRHSRENWFRSVKTVVGLTFLDLLVTDTYSF